MRPCTCDSPECRMCWAWNDPGEIGQRYREAWRAEEEKPGSVFQKSQVRNGPCKHLGEATGETVFCRSCEDEHVSVFKCGEFGKCTLEKDVVNSERGRIAGVEACCRTCKSYAAKGEEDASIR